MLNGVKHPYEITMIDAFARVQDSAGYASEGFFINSGEKKQVS